MKEPNRTFDEHFMRISLQNREFSLIIVYVGSAKASRVGHDPVYGRHAGVRERTNCRRLVFFLFFLFQKNYIGTGRNGQEENAPFPTARSDRQY